MSSDIGCDFAGGADLHIDDNRRGVFRQSLALVLCLSCWLYFGPAYAFDTWQLQHVSVRDRVSDSTALGEDAPEEFDASDIAAHFDLPWRYPAFSQWHFGTGVMTSIGVLSSEEKEAMVLSFVPLLTFASQDGRFVFDAGAGAALLNRQRFGEQDFGGHFQFALTVGLRVPIYKKLGIGYRFQHYSDAGIHSSTSIGADLHMIELSYQF